MDRKDPQMLPFCGSKSTASFQAARLSWKGSNLQWTWINCQVVWSHGWLDGYSKTLKKLSRWNEVKKKSIIKIHHLLPPNKRLEPEFTSLKGRFIFQTFIFGFQPFVFGGVVGRVRSLRRLTSKAPEGRCNFGGLFPRADWNCSFQWWHVYIYIYTQEVRIFYEIAEKSWDEHHHFFCWSTKTTHYSHYSNETQKRTSVSLVPWRYFVHNSATKSN